MAYNNHTSFALLLILLFTATNPFAHGLINPLRGVSVTGQLCCTSTGSCPGQGISNVTVQLNCTVLGAVVNIGNATTTATGSFNITVPTRIGFALGQPILPCYVGVRLPLNSTVCPVLSTTEGVLASAVRSVGTLLTSALGLIQDATIVGFIYFKV